MKYTLTINHVTSFFSKLLNNAAFHTSLLACALEVVMATYVGKSFLVFLPFTLLQQLIVLSKPFLASVYRLHLRWNNLVYISPTCCFLFQGTP